MSLKVRCQEREKQKILGKRQRERERVYLKCDKTWESREIQKSHCYRRKVGYQEKVEGLYFVRRFLKSEIERRRRNGLENFFSAFVSSLIPQIFISKTHTQIIPPLEKKMEYSPESKFEEPYSPPSLPSSTKQIPLSFFSNLGLWILGLCFSSTL